MKKITLFFTFSFLVLLAKAQNGLECVEVEVYYVSNANDTIANSAGGVLPIGSVTYRVYADMLQGYKFQAAYGVPGHELRLETSTLFFNNIDRGATSPTFTKTQARTNTVMVDSWFSVGAACVGNYGIFKTDDDTVANVVNNFVPQVLQNNDADAGIPLTQKDGFMAGNPEQVTFVGFTAPELDVFDAGTVGNLLSTHNASWASLNGSKGFDTVANKVLIGQFTTDGIFSFKLNIQIGTPTGGVENYVADSAVGNEIVLSCLTYVSLVDTVIDTTGVGIINDLVSSAFSVYPNPTNEFVTVTYNHSKSSAYYTLLDISGKVLAYKKLDGAAIKNSELIDLSMLANGIYIMQLSADGITTNKKIIKN